jgi:hypothetical protein
MEYKMLFFSTVSTNLSETFFRSHKYLASYAQVAPKKTRLGVHAKMSLIFGQIFLTNPKSVLQFIRIHSTSHWLLHADRQNG